MFVDFDKVFCKTPQTELKIPEALAEQLSSNLPDGLKYVHCTKTNTLIISHDNIKNENITIKGITPLPTTEQKEILGNNYNVKDLMKLSYNSQKPIPIKLNRDKYININGKDVSLSQIDFNPFKPYEIEKVDSAYIYPSSFPPAFSLSVGCDKVSVDLTVNRIPNNSVDDMLFESDNHHCLYVKYYLNPITHRLLITIKVMPKNATTVKDIIDSIEIYNAFIEGHGIFAGTNMKTKLATSESIKYDSDILEFWTKVYELEKALSVIFVPPFIDMDFEDICNIEEIYQNIINKAPIRKNTSVNSITSKWEPLKDDIAKDNLGKHIYFEFEGTSSFELFGQKIELPCIVGIFNAILSKYEKSKTKEECTLFLENESAEKQMYKSTLRFLTEDELVEYKQNTKNRILLFRDAKKCHEYLI